MNQAHCTTFTALFKLYGLSEEGSQAISRELAHINNDTQDRLIAILSSELVNNQNLAAKLQQK